MQNECFGSKFVPGKWIKCHRFFSISSIVMKSSSMKMRETDFRTQGLMLELSMEESKDPC